jgi:anti-anti-sigma regulatory factor
MSPVQQSQTCGRSTLFVSGRLVRGPVADDLLSQGARMLEGADLWLDLSSVTALDGAGLGVLVALHNHAQSCRRALQLQAPSLAVSSMLRLMRLDGVFHVCPAQSRAAQRLSCCA